MTANVRFVFVCFGKRFSRGVPFVRSFVYSLDFLLFLTARRRHGLLLPAMLNNVPVCFIILLFASSRRVLLVFSYIFTLLFIFCFACKTTAMFNRFVSIYGSIIAENGGKKGAERIFAYFLNVRFPPLAFSSLLTTWIVDALTGQWHSPIASSKPNEKVVEM